MIKIDYPSFSPKIKQGNDKEFIFDPFRKRWVVLTPEEWVRQNFLHYLVQVKKFPPGLISVEKGIKLVDLKKRFDIVVFDSNTRPWMIVECKQMNVPINETVLNQVLRYNITLKAKYVVITNGSYCRAVKFEGGVIHEINSIPEMG